MRCCGASQRHVERATLNGTFPNIKWQIGNIKLQLVEGNGSDAPRALQSRKPHGRQSRKNTRHPAKLYGEESIVDIQPTAVR